MNAYHDLTELAIVSCIIYMLADGDTEHDWSRFEERGGVWSGRSMRRSELMRHGAPAPIAGFDWMKHRRGITHQIKVSAHVITIRHLTKTVIGLLTNLIVHSISMATVFYIYSDDSWFPRFILNQEFNLLLLHGDTLKSLVSITFT